MFWCLCYIGFYRPTSLEACLLAKERTRPPWWRFKPFLYRNEEGGMWEIYLSESESYVKSGMLEVELMCSQETGEVVGLNIWDERLRAASD